MSKDVTQLKVSDESFLVSSLIERCPKVMMLRELVKNAIEAAESAPEGERRIEISRMIVDGIPKLAIWNTGHGMTADELFRMCDIASSIGKQKGLEQNFGMGAKVASLPSNQHGLRYRSCSGGRVHEVTIGKRGGVYGRVRRPNPVTGELADTIDVTNQAAAEGRPLGHDWTEVVLLGNSPSLDTSGDPYAHDPPVPVTWVADDLYNKFFKLPDGVEIWLMNGANRLGGHRQFATMAQRATSAFAHYEAVNAGPATVHYFYDVREYGVGKSSVNALQNARGMVGLIYKDEIYDIQSEGLWVQLAPVFGIPFGAGSFTILIELPPDAHVLPDAYRQFLRYREQTQRHVAARDYSALVSQHRPQWLLDLLLQLAPDSAHAENVRGEMNELFKDLRVPRRSKRQPGPAIHGPPGDDWEVAPQIVTIRDNVDLEERGLRGRAARFYATTHQLFVNCLYPAVQDMRALLETEFSAEEEPELVRSQSLVLAEQAAVRAVGRHLVFCLARRAKDDTWHDLDHAMSPATLSIIADDYLPAMEAARKQMREAIALASTAKAA